MAASGSASVSGTAMAGGFAASAFAAERGTPFVMNMNVPGRYPCDFRDVFVIAEKSGLKKPFFGTR
jgi:hypothetical protein